MIFTLKLKKKYSLLLMDLKFILRKNLVTLRRSGQEACGCATSNDSSSAMADPSGRLLLVLWWTGNKWGDVRTNHGAGAELSNGEKIATSFNPRRNTLNSTRRRFSSLYTSLDFCDKSFRFKTRLHTFYLVLSDKLKLYKCEEDKALITVNSLH